MITENEAWEVPVKKRGRPKKEGASDVQAYGRYTAFYQDRVHLD